MEGALKTMAIAKIKMAGIGILVALLIGTTGVVLVTEIQKRQPPGASGKPDIVASPAKQEVHDQPMPSKLETKGKTQSAKVKVPPKARNFQAEMEEALARSPKGDHPAELHIIMSTIMREWLDYDKDGAIEWTLRMTGEHKRQVLGIVAYCWASKNPVAASEWVMKFKENPTRDQLLNDLVVDWAEKEPDKAKNWIVKSSLSQNEKDKPLKLISKK